MSNVGIYWANEKMNDDAEFAQKNSYFWMKLIFIFMGTLIIKITVFKAQKSHSWSYKSKYAHYE